jgi:hypothetical protein
MSNTDSSLFPTARGFSLLNSLSCFTRLHKRKKKSATLINIQYTSQMALTMFALPSRSFGDSETWVPSFGFLGEAALLSFPFLFLRDF